MTAITRIMAVMALGWLLGCGPSFRLHGTWIGKRTIDTVPGADPAIVGTLSKVELRVDDKGHFVLFESGIPKEGTITYAGNTATLHIDRIAGQRGEATAKRIERHEDGTIVYIDPDLIEPPVVLTTKR